MRLPRYAFFRLRHLIDWPLALLPRDPSGPISISLAHNSEAERRTRDELLGLIERPDLRRWQFTNRVRIDETTRIPHSHPVLTLNTRYEGDLLLSTYLHEQLHWFAWRHRGTKPALRELRERYPQPPVALPEGAGSEFATYLHYLVCYLEYAALIDILGPEEARRVIGHWSSHHYTEIYETVLRDSSALGEVAARHGLVPE
jgi:hypothetical protein